MQRSIKYREMSPSDYPGLFEIWQETPELTLRKADTVEGFIAFLKRNPGLSFVAKDQELLIGGILGGHDGRFGSIHHLVVLPDYRNHGIGQKLASLSLEKIEAEGIEKCHIFVNKSNKDGLDFWKKRGWVERIDLIMASHTF